MSCSRHPQSVSPYQSTEKKSRCGGNGQKMFVTAEDGLLHLEYSQDGLRVVNRQCKMESISFAIPSSDSPPDCPPSPLPNTQSSSPPKAPGPSPCHKK